MTRIEEMRRAIAPHRVELDEDAAIGAEAVLGERGRGDSDRATRGGAIVWGDPDAGAEIEGVGTIQQALEGGGT